MEPVTEQPGPSQLSWRWTFAGFIPCGVFAFAYRQWVLGLVGLFHWTCLFVWAYNSDQFQHMMERLTIDYLTGQLAWSLPWLSGAVYWIYTGVCGLRIAERCHVNLSTRQFIWIMVAWEIAGLAWAAMTLVRVIMITLIQLGNTLDAIFPH